MRKFFWVAGTFALMCAGLGIYAQAWSTTLLTATRLQLDLNTPDVLIRTKSLSRLPADLLRVPLLRDLLSEDFLFYYEHGEDRLGLRGTIRRIAYEHNETFTDDIIKLTLNETAEIALWRGKRGDLKYYSLAMTRNQLAKILEPIAKIALKDRQLTLVGETNIEGETVKFFALNYGWEKTLLFASRGDRVIVFSEPGMVLNEKGLIDPSAFGILSALLSKDAEKQRLHTRAFQLNATENDHSIAVRTDFLAFSYQAFFPALKALRFDFSGNTGKGATAWSTALLVDVQPSSTPTAGTRALWSALPGKPGLCAAIPADWKRLAGAVSVKSRVKPFAEKLSAQLEGPGAVCWYAQSRLHTPLFIARLSSTNGSDEALSAVYSYGMNGEDQGEEDAPPAPYATPTTNPAGDKVWQVGDERRGGWRPMLARNGNYVYFSPDPALVEQALAVSHKLQPALSDGWANADSAATLAVIFPKQLTQLAKQEVTISLPTDKNQVLRDAAERHLFPRLTAIEKYTPLRMQLQQEKYTSGWVALDWR